MNEFQKTGFYPALRGVLFSQRISLPALQRLLGHDHLATTEIYLSLSPEHLLQTEYKGSEENYRRRGMNLRSV